jgi:hypothetical protein
MALPPTKKKKNQVWTSGIDLDGFVLEVTDFKELVEWS